ncbi:MAG: hypothetical protein NVSMB57_08030 [Actinomycetota bacterium]
MRLTTWTLTLAMMLSGCTKQSGPPAARVASPAASHPQIPCAGDARTLHLIASHELFDADCVATSSGHSLTLTLENRDKGVNHNVQILPIPFGYNNPPHPLFATPIKPGPYIAQDTIPSLPAGWLSAICYVHHDTMVFSFGVAPSVTTTNDGYDVYWGTAPAGFVFDVQARVVGSTDWTPWLSNTVTSGATYPRAPGKANEFRVALYRARFGVVGWSPAATAP